jgi:hypothetical protein
MSQIEIDGLDSRRNGYRITLSDGSGTALVPQAVIDAEIGRSRASEADAMEWLAAMDSALAMAIQAKQAGHPVAAPLDRIELLEPGS